MNLLNRELPGREEGLYSFRSPGSCIVKKLNVVLKEGHSETESPANKEVDRRRERRGGKKVSAEREINHPEKKRFTGARKRPSQLLE